MQALSAAALAETAPDAPDSESAAGATHNDIELACHEVLRRMRGPSRPRPRERSRGHLDMRRTVRSSLRTDGIPFHLVVKAPRPIVFDYFSSPTCPLSVRPMHRVHSALGSGNGIAGQIVVKSSPSLIVRST